MGTMTKWPVLLLVEQKADSSDQKVSKKNPLSQSFRARYQRSHIAAGWSLAKGYEVHSTKADPPCVKMIYRFQSLLSLKFLLYAT